MAKKMMKKAEGTKLLSIIGDEDTVTGFLLAGIGERNVKGETNFLIVDAKTPANLIIETFKKFVKDDNIAIILVNQNLVEKELRATINNEYSGIVSKMLEIPSKDQPYDPKKGLLITQDTVMNKASRLLFGCDFQ